MISPHPGPGRGALSRLPGDKWLSQSLSWQGRRYSPPGHRASLSSPAAPRRSKSRFRPGSSSTPQAFESPAPTTLPPGPRPRFPRRSPSEPIAPPGALLHPRNRKHHHAGRRHRDRRRFAGRSLRVQDNAPPSRTRPRIHRRSDPGPNSRSGGSEPVSRAVPDPNQPPAAPPPIRSTPCTPLTIPPPPPRAPCPAASSSGTPVGESAAIAFPHLATRAADLGGTGIRAGVRVGAYGTGGRGTDLLRFCVANVGRSATSTPSTSRPRPRKSRRRPAASGPSTPISENSSRARKSTRSSPAPRTIGMPSSPPWPVRQARTFTARNP